MRLIEKIILEFNTNHIGVKYPLIVLGKGGRGECHFELSILSNLLAILKKNLSFLIESELNCHEYGSIKQGYFFY